LSRLQEIESRKKEEEQDVGYREQEGEGRAGCRK
jgi:hypothetical protein